MRGRLLAMGRTGRALALIAGAVLAGAAAAQDAPMPIVVELFTSQGCSSCPPADDILRDLAGRDDVIALALHVDYWDYIGWADVFARPEFTRRQHRYARAAGEHMVYTPQFIVGGQDHVIGARPMEVMDHVRGQAAIAARVMIEAARQGDALQIHLSAVEGAPVGPLQVQLVRYLPARTVTIERGENAGLTLEYANIVTGWQMLADWTGAAPLSLTAAAPGPERAVVIVQEPGPGRIVAARALP